MPDFLFHAKGKILRTLLLVVENLYFFFVSSEGELEEVLTTYTKINKSAAIFLGGDSKPGGSPMSDNKREIFRRRDIPDNVYSTGAMGSTDDATRSKQGESSFCLRSSKKIRVDESSVIKFSKF